MKLELKHLAAYFPYKLKVKVPSGIRVIKGLNQTEAGSFGVHYWRDGREHFAWSIDCKPILRPLSDLTKPCLEGGKVPLTELLKKSGFKTEIIKWKDQLEYLRLYQDIDLIDFLTSQWLFEKHFDIYNLIQNGLAIDINTINEEK